MDKKKRRKAEEKMERRNRNIHEHDSMGLNSEKEKRMETARGGFRPTMDDHSLMMKTMMIM